MAKNTSEKNLKIAMAAVIAVVLALGVAALYPVVTQNVRDRKAIEQLMAQQTRQGKIDEGESNVAEIAETKGMEVEELLEYYNVTEAGLNGESAQADFEAQLTFKKYVEFKGKEVPTEEAWAEFKTAKAIAEDVTMDTLDENVKTTYMTYLEEKEAAEAEASAAEDTADAETPAE